MMTEEEKLFAWLDGELGPAEAAEMKAKVAADPGFARLAEQHRMLGDRLHGLFDPILAAPVPEQLQKAVHPSAAVIDFATARPKRPILSASQWMGLAASLAVGIFLGTMVPRPDRAPVEVQGGKMYAAAALNQALNTQLASAPAGNVRIGITFRNHAGEICRSFSSTASSGLACRNGGRWQLKGMFAVPEGQDRDYRMAAGMDPNLASLVDATIAGEPLDAAGERTARDKDWR